LFEINILAGIAPERMRLRLWRIIDDDVLAVLTATAAVIATVVH